MVAPSFYEQISGTVILCDLSFTTDLKTIESVSLECQSLLDPNLPAATEQELGIITKTIEFYGKIGI